MQRKAPKRQRRLFLQHLEARECLSFICTGLAGDILRFTGTQFADSLNSIYVATGTVWFRTNATIVVDTRIPSPTAAAPIQISIDGLGGNDLVDLLLGTFTPAEDNLAGFPNNSVTKLKFAGQWGNDTFYPPEGRAAATGPGAVILPPAGALPNISFYGDGEIDTLHNGEHPELFYGDEGNDIVTVSAGGGGGNDRLYGGLDDDVLDGGGDDDQIDGNAGNDTLTGGAGGDTINGGSGDDTLAGNAGHDVLIGDDGGDTIMGGNDADLIYTGTTGVPVGGLFIADTVDGGNGDDVIYGDTATYRTTLVGNDGDDWIVGSSFDDLIYGGKNNDVLYGGAGKDYIVGEEGDDMLYGEADPDDLRDSTGTNFLHGGSSDDLLQFNAGSTFDGGADNDDVYEIGGRGVIFDLDTEKDWHPKIDGVTAQDGAGTVITSIVKTPDSKVHLVASGVADMGGNGTPTVSEVRVYREDPGGDGILKLVDDVLIGAATAEGGGTYKKTVDVSTLAAGKHTFYVVAYDNETYWGAYDSVEGTIKAAPKAEDDAYFRAFGMGGIVSVDSTEGVLENDTDEDSETITAVLYSSPTNGSLSLNNDGSFTYTRNSGGVTYDTFQYRAFDGEFYSEPATVTLNLTNPSPIAVDDSYSMTAVSGTLSVHSPGVLGNDYDPDGQSVSAAIASYPSHGWVSLGSDGSLSYTPYTGFTGTDTFTYLASDSYSSSSPATVSITVTNQAPVASDDAYSMSASSGTMYVYSPGALGNDSDPDGQLLTATATSCPAHGSLSFNTDGSFSYTPYTGFVGTDSFSYQANDGFDSSSTATVSLTITNTAPSATDDSYNTESGVPLSVNMPGILANDGDPDWQTLIAILLSGTAHGSLSLNPDGSFSYTSEAGFTGTDWFMYQASDGYSASNTATVMIIVGKALPPV